MSFVEQETARTTAVSVLTGFLGSGKTTLLNHLLQHPDMEETAVLINEFGDVGLDHLLVRELDDGVLLLSTGCICCTIKGELVTGLRDLHMKRIAGNLPNFSRILIETSGLADPAPIISCLMQDPLFKHALRLDALITTVDLLYGWDQLERHPEAVKQAAMADRIILTKPDLADGSAIENLRQRLHKLNPGARVIMGEFGRVPPARLFDCGLFDPKTKSLEVQHWLNAEAYVGQEEDHDDEHDHESEPHRHNDHDQIDLNRHDEHIAAFCVTVDEPIEWRALLDWYDTLATEKGDHLLRVKGIVNVKDEEQPFAIHCVQATRHTPLRLPGWPDEDRRSRIVFVTHDLSREVIEESLKVALARPLRDLDLEGSAAARADPVQPQAQATRERWLNDAEISRLFGTLAKHPDQTAASAIRLLLLTGSRTSEVLGATWGQFELERGVWETASRKSFAGKPRRVRLSEPALMLLRHMRAQDSEGKFLFPGEKRDKPLQDIGSFWQDITVKAQVNNAPLKALRPVLASRLFDGLDQDLIRELLGIGVISDERSEP